jgi:hypothetical protein
MNNLQSNHPSWGVAKEFHEALALGFSGALLEEVRGGFNDTAFSATAAANSLVQGDTVLFGQALRRPS